LICHKSLLPRAQTDPGDALRPHIVAVSVIKRFELLFESVCSDVQVASDDVR